MIDFNFQKECYACSACINACSQNAITMDEECHPIVNKTKCINCHQCEKVCINLNESVFSPDLNPVASYIGKNIDDAIRRNSSSGGIFYILAKNIIEDGGAVCGCTYDNQFLPHHTMAYNQSDLISMMGSKYVMSDMGDCINKVKQELNLGKRVLFSGVPCQIQAVNRSIKDKSNLLLVAVVCHGSINRRIWKRYLEEQRKGRKVVSVTMRDKAHGWLNYGLRIKYDDGTESISYRKETGYFLKSYTDGLFERERCLDCNYKGTNIAADILLGDAWGVEKTFPEITDQLGVSSIICLTPKGFELFEESTSDIDKIELDYKEIISGNQRIISSAPLNPLRNLFIRELENSNESIYTICKKYSVPSLPLKLYSKIFSNIRDRR